MFRHLFRRNEAPPPAIAPPTDYLDTPLLMLSSADVWTIRDACEGVQVFGAIGSGKTSGSGAAIAKAFLRQGFGGLVLCAKPEERRLWQQYAAETGRTQSLVVFAPGESWRFNFLYELRRQGTGGGQTENLVRLFSSVTEIVEGKQSQGSGGDPFWERAGQELIRNAIDLIALSGETLTLSHLLDFITSAPQDSAQVGDLQWQQTSYCAGCIAKAQGKAKTPREQHDFEMGVRYWLQSYATLADRTRSGIVAHVTGVADILLHGIAWELLATETNIVPEVTYKNSAIIIVDLSIQEYDRLGRIVQGIWKLMFQRAILRRDVNADPKPVFLWADEAQNFISSFDYQFQAVARSARACTVYLSQNISNYYSVLGSQGRDEANALLGNFQTKVFHANGDHPTNQYAADTIGQQWTTTGSDGVNSSQQNSSFNLGSSESVQYKVQPAEFTVLRKGGPSNGLKVDAILFQGGRIFYATDDTYLKTTFTQG